MWPFTRKSGSQRCEVYFRSDAVLLALPEGLWKALGASPSPQELGKAVLDCLAASRPASGLTERFPDFKESPCLQVERVDKSLHVTPVKEGESDVEASRAVSEAALGAHLLENIPPSDDPQPDLPRAFGRKAMWIAARTDQPAQLAKAMNLKAVRPSGWARGLERAGEGEGIFVTPPVEGWCLAVGELPEPDERAMSDPGLLLLSDVSQRLSEAHFFCSNRVVDLYAWARARDGMVERAFASGEVHWNVGRPTPQEAEFRFFDPSCPEAASDAYWSRTDLRNPDEECVLRVAAGWSLDPSLLEARGLEPSLGLFGRL